MEWTVETCVIALVVAIALLWLVFSVGRSERSTSQIVAADLDDDEPSAPHMVEYKAVDDGRVRIVHRGLMLADGDTVNVIVTTTGTTMLITEKRGLMAPAGSTATPRTATMTINFATCYPHTVRFESDLTGEWSVVTLTPTADAHLTAELKL